MGVKDITTGIEVKRLYSVDQRRAMLKMDPPQVLPDLSFPIADRADVQNARDSIGRAGPNEARDKAWIIKRARALGATDLLQGDYWGLGKDGEPEDLQTKVDPEDIKNVETLHIAMKEVDPNDLDSIAKIVDAAQRLGLAEALPGEWVDDKDPISAGNVEDANEPELAVAGAKSDEEEEVETKAADASDGEPAEINDASGLKAALASAKTPAEKAACVAAAKKMKLTFMLPKGYKADEVEGGVETTDEPEVDGTKADEVETAEEGGEDVEVKEDWLGDLRVKRLIDMGIENPDADSFVCANDRSVKSASADVCASCTGGCASEPGLPGLLDIEAIAMTEHGDAKVLDSAYSPAGEVFIVDLQKKDGSYWETIYSDDGIYQGEHRLDESLMSEKSAEDSLDGAIITADQAAELAVKSLESEGEGEALGIGSEMFEGTDAYAVEVKTADGREFDVYVGLDGTVLGYDEYSSDPEVDGEKSAEESFDPESSAILADMAELALIEAELG